MAVSVAELGAAIPDSGLTRGLAVISSEGAQVGSVHVVVRAGDALEALVIQEQEGLRVVGADKVKSIHENGVVLGLGTKACHRLPRADDVVAADGPGMLQRARRLLRSR